MKKRTTLLLYLDQLEAVLPVLSYEEQGQLLTALFLHAKTDEPQELPSAGGQVAYSIIARAMDANYEHYEQVREKRAEAGRRSRELANASKSQQMSTNANRCAPSTSTNTSTSSSTSTGTSTSLPTEDVVVVFGATAPTTTKKTPSWKAPSLEEVSAYCAERGNDVDAERFIDYYTANGWRVGRNHMKDWRAAVRTWERKEPKRAAPSKTFSQIAAELNERMAKT